MIESCVAEVVDRLRQKERTQPILEIGEHSESPSVHAEGELLGKILFNKSHFECMLSN